MSFEIVSETIGGESLISDPRAGGFVVFEGRVRDHNDGESVDALEYEAYAELAVTEGARILEEAKRRFPILDAAARHRVGRLEIGDVAVRIEVAAEHRREAFRACEWIIDEVKACVPIWKKEHYVSGVTEWINAQSGGSSVTEELYYERQRLLAGFGSEGQARLRSSSVLVVGAGGLGCAALPYLAAAGVGRITLVDSDQVEGNNLHRQVLYGTADVGRPKAAVAAERLAAQNPFVEVTAHRSRVDATNVVDLVQSVDLVLDCTDNFETKFLLSDACARAMRPLVQASIYQFEGQLHLYDPGDRQSGCIRCLWPETPAEGCVASCAEAGVLGVVPGVLGALQACEAIKFLTKVGESLARQMVVLDLLTIATTRLDRPRDVECPACAGKIPLSERPSYEADPDADLSVFARIDIREPDEQREDPIDKAIAVPLSSFRVERLEPGRPYLLICATGRRSAALAQRLHADGWTNFLSLPGGRKSLG